jgi:hypothetical protein
MKAIPEPNFPKDYRTARKAFIAACTRAQADSIARVHPAASGPKGNPLFLDSVALGPRDGRKALLLIAGSHGNDGLMGSALLTGLLDSGLRPPPGARLLMVHALNPFGMARGSRENETGIDLDTSKAAQSWSFAMLRDIMTEDLAHAEKLRILELGRGKTSRLEDRTGSVLAQVLAAARPGANIRVARLVLAPDGALAQSRAVTARALAEL